MSDNSTATSRVHLPIGLFTMLSDTLSSHQQNLACHPVAYHEIHMESHLAVNLPSLPLMLLHIADPVNITVCNNIFINFRDGAVEFVGLITNLNTLRWIMVVRKFLTWEQLKQLVPQARVEDVSFWPHSKKPPFFLCNTDLVTDIQVKDILSIAMTAKICYENFME
jgi:hypothetical protein